MLLQRTNGYVYISLHGPKILLNLRWCVVNTVIRSVYPYIYRFTPDNPQLLDPAGHRWEWLVCNIGRQGDLWDLHIPFSSTEDLVYYFANRDDYVRFVLIYG